MRICANYEKSLPMYAYVHVCMYVLYCIMHVLTVLYSMLVDDDLCRSLPCQNGGQCKSLSSGYTCDCRPGTTGRQCETGIYFLLVYNMYIVL